MKKSFWNLRLIRLMVVQHMTSLSVVICTYNRAGWLCELIAALRTQKCSLPFEILVIDNNSSDETRDIVKQLANAPGAAIRYVRETRQGIAFARNRAIESCNGSDFMAFIDDDELPEPGWIESACDSLKREGAECVGGRIRLRFEPHLRPAWLTDQLLRYLGHLDHGETKFWISDKSTPIWTGNIAYRMSLFKAGDLRFDLHYNRAGKGIGGGEDEMIFRALLTRGAKIRYRPDMIICHRVEPFKLKRRYFLRLRSLHGCQAERYEGGEYRRTVAGIPPYMIEQALRHWWRVVSMLLRNEQSAMRQSMIASYASGRIWGRILRMRDVSRKSV
jgi:glycosyltransferase involved in cell wall biosynthesis